MIAFKTAFASDLVLEYRYGPIACRLSCAGASVDTQFGLSGQGANDRIVNDAYTSTEYFYMPLECFLNQTS
jgi:hypothetical protein